MSGSNSSGNTEYKSTPQDADVESQRVRDRYHLSENELISKMRPKWTEWYQAYRAFVDEHQDDSIKSNLFVPLIFSHIESTLPRLVASRPEVQVWGEGPVDDARSSAHRVMLLHSWRKMDMRLKVIELCKSGEIFGTAWWKVDYLRKERQKQVRRFEESLPAKVLGIFPGGVGDIIKKLVVKTLTVTVWDDVWAESCDIDSIFPDPRGKTEDHCRWIIEKKKVSVSSLEEERDVNGEPMYQHLNKLRELMKEGNAASVDAGHKSVMGTVGDEGGTPSEMTLDTHDREVWILEEWTDDKRTTVCLEYEQLPPIQSIVNDIGMKPFVRFTPIPIPNELYGMSIAEVLYSLNLELNTIHNANLDNVLMTVHQMMTVARHSNVDPRQLRFRPGGYVEVDSHDDINWLSPPEKGFAAHRESQNIRMWAQLASGSNDTLGGVSTGLSGGTATEANLLAQAAGTRVNLMFEVLSVQALGRFGKLVTRWHEATTTTEKYARVDGGHMSEPEWVAISPEELAKGSGADLSVVIDVAAGEPVTRQMKLQRGMQGIQILSQVFPPNHPAIETLIADVLFGLEM